MGWASQKPSSLDWRILARLIAVTLLILQPVKKFLHLRRERIVTCRERAPEATFVDGAHRLAGVVVVSLNALHN
jgi:hypothetical protein